MKEIHVIGPPGTGKTTYLSGTNDRAGQIERAAAKYGSERVWVTSYTKAAAVEIASRKIPIPRQNVGTLHSFCYRLLNYPEIAEVHLQEFNEAYPDHAVSGSAALDDDLDVKDNEPEESSGGDRAYAKMQLARARCEPIEDDSTLAFRAAWEEWKRACGYRDYQDLIDASYEMVEPPRNLPAVLLIDEAQDHSPSELRLLKRWAEYAETVVFVHDAWQSLYHFKGADAKYFIEHEPDHRIVLSRSHRVPRLIRDRALGWIKNNLKGPGRLFDVIYEPRDADGAVDRMPLATWINPCDVVEDAEQRATEGQTAMILTTCAYMLQYVIDALRKRGIPYHNPYRRKQGAWNPLRPGSGSAAARLLAFLRPDVSIWGRESRPWTAADLDKWMQPIRAEVFQRGVKAAMKNVARRSPDQVFDVEAAERLFKNESHAERAMEGDLEWYQNHLLKPRPFAFPLKIVESGGARKLLERPKIIVGTVHSAKGGEADHVYLFPEYSAAAERSMRGVDGWDAMVRTFYVGMTRARERLVIAGADDVYRSLAL